MINSLKNKLEQTYLKEQNVRKQASFNLVKTQRFYPMLTAFNVIKSGYLKVSTHEQV